MHKPEFTRPVQLPGITTKYKFSDQFGADVSFYITINCLAGSPYEILIDCKNAIYSEHLNALMHIINLSLNNGVTLDSIASELCDVHSPFTSHMSNGAFVNSLYAGIGQVFKSHRDVQ